MCKVHPAASGMFIFVNSKWNNKQDTQGWTTWQLDFFEAQQDKRGNCRNSDVSNISAIGGIDIGGITYIGGIDGMTIQRRPRHTYSLSDKRRE